MSMRETRTFVETTGADEHSDLMDYLGEKEEYVRCPGRHTWAFPISGDDGVHCTACGREIHFEDLDEIRRNSIIQAQIRHLGDEGRKWVRALEACQQEYEMPTNDVHVIDPLIRSNCHLVFASKTKIPIHYGWQETSANPWQAREHADEGLVGILPGKSDIIVIDIDGGENPEKLIEAHPPLEVVRTPGGYHLYYERVDEYYANQKWSAMGLHGDIRGDNGYVVAWEPWKVERAIQKMRENPGAHPFPFEAADYR